jgi:hypothetical protein
MWIFTRYGFFSISCPEWCKNELQVRARARKHLAALQERFQYLRSFEIRETPDADYRYRILVPKQMWSETVAILAQEQIWSNFKNEANRFQHDPLYDDVLHKIWSIMYAASNEWRKQDTKANP